MLQINLINIYTKRVYYGIIILTIIVFCTLFVCVFSLQVHGDLLLLASLGGLLCGLGLGGGYLRGHGRFLGYLNKRHT